MRTEVVALALVLAVPACSKVEFTYEDVDGGGATSSGGGPSGGTGGSAGTAAGGVAGLGGAATLEDCTNGVDDDADGLSDCEDTDACDCLPQKLSGWQGPYVVTPAAIDDADPVACPTGTEVDVLGVVEAPPAQCPTCSCQAPKGGCTQATAAYYASASCAGTGSPLLSPLSGCKQTGFSGTPPQSVSVQVSPTGAACPSATNGSRDVPSTRFIERRRLCAASLGACSAGHCTRRLPTGHKACVLGSTGQACPNAYSVATDLDTGVISVDARTCTACACTISQATCTGWKVLHGNSCSLPGGYGAFGPTVPCKALSSSSVSLSVDSLGSVSATCTPTGGKPSGAVTAEQVRLCCTS